MNPKSMNNTEGEDIMSRLTCPPGTKPYEVGGVIPKKKPTHPWRCHADRPKDRHDKHRIPYRAMMGIRV